MAYTLTIPTAKDFHFVIDLAGDVPEIHRLKEDESVDGRDTFKVSFRQATRQEGEQRSEWASRRKYAVDPDTGQLVEMANFNIEILKKMEVGLTLCGTDLSYPEVVKTPEGQVVKDEDGNPKTAPKDLEFVNVGGVRRVKTESQFNAWWGLQPDQWADEIYACCMEVNPKWASKSLL